MATHTRALSAQWVVHAGSVHRLRVLSDHDVADVLDLNHRNVHLLAPMDQARLHYGAQRRHSIHSW